MRIRASWIMLLILAGITPYGWSAMSQFWAPEVKPLVHEGATDYSKSATFVLNEQGLEFEIPPQATQVRLLLNANIAWSIPEHPDKMDLQREWPFQVQYRLTSENGHEVVGYHEFLASLPLYKKADHLPFANRKLLGSNLIPTSTRVFALPVESDKHIWNRVQIRIVKKDNEIADIGVRLYARVHRPEAELPYRWNRMGTQEKDRLASGSVHDFQALTLVERTNLLRTIQRPLAPIGQKDHDYESRTMYTFRIMEDLQIRPEIHRQIRECHAERDVTINILSSQRVKLVFKSLVNKDPHVRLQFIGEESSWRLDCDQREFEKTFEEAGTLIVCSQEPVQVDLLQKTDKMNDFVEVPYEPLYQRVYLASKDSHPEYEITHIDQSPTVCKLSLRALLKDNQHESETVLYTFLDKDDNIVHQQSIAFPTTPSRFDRGTSPFDQFEVSEPVERYMRIPRQVSRVQFDSDAAVLVHLSNRPNDIPKRTLIPEDYSSTNWRQTGNRTWFPFRPLRYQKIVEEELAPLLEVQNRPQVEETQQNHSDLEWEDFVPREFWTGTYLLTPTAELSLLSDRESPAYFTEISANHSTAVNWHGDPGRKSVSPTLICLANRPTKVLFVIDDKILDTFQIDQGINELSCSSIPVTNQPQTLRIETDDDVRSWVNHNSWATDNKWLKRFALNVIDSQLTFRVQKRTADQENLSIRLFGNVANRQMVRVQVTGMRPGRPTVSETLTFTEREFDIAPNQVMDSFVISTKARESIDSGQLAVVPLGEDLAPGMYEVVVDLEESAYQYAIVSRLWMGSPTEVRDIQIEVAQ